MKTKIIVLLSSLLLISGCSLFVKREIVIQKEYITRSTPSEYFLLPDYPDKIDLETATQKEASLWVTKQYNWAEIVKAKLKEIQQMELDFIKEVQSLNEKEKGSK
jgi:hypothetical protein